MKGEQFWGGIETVKRKVEKKIDTHIKLLVVNQVMISEEYETIVKRIDHAHTSLHNNRNNQILF